MSAESNPNWNRVLGSAIVSLTASSLVMLGVPSSDPWAVGLLFGCSLVATGVGITSLARAAGRAVVDSHDSGQRIRNVKRQ